MEDNVFIGTNELIIGGVGIGIALVLLVILSLLQTTRAKREGQERLDKLTEKGAALPDAAAGKIPFFIACYRGNNPRFFRVYRGAQELLFLYAGQYYAMIDAESPRGSDERHWLLRSLKMLYITLAGGAVMAVAALFAIMRGVAHNAANNPAGARDILLIVLAVIAFMAVVVVILVPSVLWEITKRCRELDALPLSGLRAQSELHPKSFRASLDSVAELKCTLLDLSQNFFPSSDVGAVISFKHTPTGRWKIETLTTQDTRDAIQACLAVWGPKNVEIEPKLQQRLGMLAEPAAPAKVEVLPAKAALASAPALGSATHETRQEIDLPKARGGTYSMNGCGTAVFESRGEIDWGDRIEDSDSILAVCLFAVPIIPYAAVHTSNWKSAETMGHEYRSFPIRWSADLVAWAYLRKFWFWLMFAGTILLIISLFVWQPEVKNAWINQGYNRWLMAAGGLGLVSSALLIGWGWKLSEKRHRDIRLILGRHVLGSSDPAHWTSATLRLVRCSHDVFGTPTFAEAADKFLLAGDYVPAMFAARIATNLEDRRAGEEATNRILEDPKVVQLLDQIRPEPKQRQQFLQSQWQPEQLFVG